MKILIIDRDRDAVLSLQTWLEAEGHTVTVEPVRKTALEMINEQSFDLIAIDPAPLSSVRQIALPLRWEQREDYFYLVLLGHDIEDAEVIRSGMNDKVAKPFYVESVQRVVKNAERLTAFMNKLRVGENLSYQDRVFSQRAFYQLVLSALDRAYRYAEQAYLLIIRVDNYQDIAARLGPERMMVFHRELSTYLSKLCRISDFLGHSDEAEFGLLLLRPAVDREPQDAAERFAIALRDFQSQNESSGIIPRFTIDLWALPSGEESEQIRLEG